MRNPLCTMGALALTALLAVPVAAPAQTRVEPGFNLFTEEQDVEVGRRSAEQVEQQLPMLENRDVNRFVDRLGSRLAENAPGYDFPYQFEVTNVEDINAFALPGGFMYINRGLLQAVDSESELAAVMAHEIAHVALRHGTNQASKAYLGEAGLSLITGLIGGRSPSDIVGAVGGFGLNTLFLKYSREHEREADIVGAQILARSGYDPLALVNMFDALQAKSGGGGTGGLPTFLSSHPDYDARRQVVRQEADRIGRVELRRPVGGLEGVQSRLSALEPAESSAAYLAGDADPREENRDEQVGAARDVALDPSPGEWQTYRHDQGYFLLEVPADWQVRESRGGFGVSFVPRGGMVALADGREEIVYGVMIDHYVPEDMRTRSRWGSGFTTDRDWEAPEGSELWLERASEDLVDTLRHANSHLTLRSGSERWVTVDQQRAYAVTLEGDNPVTDRRERVTVVTRETDGDGHLVYALLIAPERQWDWMDSTFDRMMSSLRINDAAAHHATSER